MLPPPMLTHSKYINLVQITRHQIFKQIHLFSLSIGRLSWITILHLASFIFLIMLIRVIFPQFPDQNEYGQKTRFFFSFKPGKWIWLTHSFIYFIYFRGLLLFRLTLSNFPPYHAFDLFLMMWFFFEMFEKEV